LTGIAAIFAFKCRTCGATHEGSPGFSFDCPWHYASLTDDQRKRTRLTADLCEIVRDKGIDRFIRTTLEIPIIGVKDPFVWGVLVSLSEQSYRRYLETRDQPDEHDSWFGWFCNRLPYYPDTINLKTHVRPRTGGNRPYLELEQSGHPLAEHQVGGLRVLLAQEIAERAAHMSG
jgi:hypothetical protein